MTLLESIMKFYIFGLKQITSLISFSKLQKVANFILSKLLFENKCFYLTPRDLKSVEITLKPQF